MMRAALLSLVFLGPSMVTAHSWIDQLMVIAPNGTMVGQPGFPRNYVQRSPSFTDSEMVFLIPPNGGQINKIDAQQMVCRPEQTTQTQSNGSPRLQASPGQSVALRYQENGHVTLPQNTPGKPDGSGANFVYYTTNSKPDDKLLDIHRQWTPDGSGGDGRGRLLSTQNFDDGQCYQINGQQISTQRQAKFKHTPDATQGEALWCQQDVQVPSDAEPGSTISLYWVWDWPTLPGTQGFPDGKQELYTTCMDIDIVASNGQSKAAARAFVQQDFGSAAIAAQFADIANPTAVKAQTIPFSGGAAASSAPATPSASAPSVSSNNPAPAPTSASESSASSVPAPSQVTVTLRETVTTTVTADIQSQPPSPTAHHATAVVTAVVTDLVTVTTFHTVESKRAINTASVPLASNACSKAANAYRLRARRPFYILPPQDLPSTVAGDDC